MSYIVPDKIPSYCAECDWSICLYPNAYCKRVHKTSELLMATEKRPDFCPLIEIPTPHGRLIDVAFEEQHYTSMTTNPTPDVTEQDKHNSLVIVRALQMAKTIIEAED